MNAICWIIFISIFFSACSVTYKIPTPGEINSKAIPSDRAINLYKPPKNGYARLIIYQEYTFSVNKYAIMIKYNPILSVDGLYTEQEADRFLCIMYSNQSCIVNIKASKMVALTHWKQPNIGAAIFLGVFGGIQSLSAIGYHSSTVHSEYDGIIFTPKNQHIYCIKFNPQISLSYIAEFYIFKDKHECLEEYRAMYKPRHRKNQTRWFEKMVKKGNEKAYKE